MTEIEDSSCAVGEAWDRHRAELMGFATVLVGRDAAHDVVGGALVNVLRAGGFEAVAHPRAYLFRAVANAASDFVRSRDRRQRREVRAALLSLPDVIPDRVDVRDAVARLSVRQRAVVYFTYWEDLPERAIAEVLGISPSSVQHHLARAKRQLRKALQ